MDNNRYKLFNYEITTDPHFQDEKHGITPRLQKMFENLYAEAQKGGEKIIGKLLKLIEEYPKNPQLKNYLSVAYKETGNIKKAREVNRWIIAEHPDYLYGKLNQAAEYFENEKYEKMTEVLGRMMEIQDLYPDRKVFHLSEVTAFNKFAVMYFIATDNQEAAKSRYDILEQIAPGHHDTEQASLYLLQGSMKAWFDRNEEEEKAKIKVKFTSEVIVPQTDKAPEFNHEEIKLLYNHGLYIGKENLDKILALPRETLIPDLEKVLQDCLSRYNYFNGCLKANGWNEETMSFAVHTMYLLGELRAEESLDTVLEIFRQGDKFLELWFGEFLTDSLWEPLYYVANNQTEKLKQFIIEPAIYTYIRSEISILMQQIALHQPERKEEVINWFKDVFQYFIDRDLTDNVVDSDAIGLMICELIDINADRLLPEIEKLYDLGYVSIGICGDLTSVKEDIFKPSKYDHSKNLMNISGRYHQITTTWAGYTAENDDNEIVYEDFEDTPEIIQGHREQKIGRNELCPCGSGKKYKKCCMIMKKD